MLAARYDCVVANPPYMGRKSYIGRLRDFIADHYKDAKSDLCTCFIDRAFAFIKASGYLGQVTMHSWMFQSSFENFRVKLLQEHTITTMAHFGNGVMGIAFGTCATIWRSVSLTGFAGSFSYTTQVDIDEEGTPFHFPVSNKRLKTCSNADFAKIPGSPLAYWASSQVIDLFGSHPFLEHGRSPRQGLATSDNTRFLRAGLRLVSRAGAWTQVKVRSDSLGKKMDSLR